MIANRTVAAIICLNYGACFLPYAMRSVIDVVDEYIIAYSPVPNHGIGSTSIPNPDTRETLQAAAFALDHDRIRWFDFSGWRSEGEQFKFGYDQTDCDVVVKLDYDECYPPNLLFDAVSHGIKEGVHEVRLPLIHHWRSFRKGFANDPAAPGRIYLKEFISGETTFATDDPLYKVRHLGYAIPVDLMRYKMSIHGHSPEFVDPNWIDNVYSSNRQFNCHPCGHSYWMTVEDLEPPDFMMDHPYANLNLIE